MGEGTVTQGASAFCKFFRASLTPRAMYLPRVINWYKCTPQTISKECSLD